MVDGVTTRKFREGSQTSRALLIVGVGLLAAWSGGCGGGVIPSQYLKQLYFDSLVFTHQGLRHLVAEVGASQIVLGTDYPYGMGDPKAVDHILGTPGLRDADRRALLGGNAAKLLRIGSQPGRQG